MAEIEDRGKWVCVCGEENIEDFCQACGTAKKIITEQGNVPVDVGEKKNTHKRILLDKLHNTNPDISSSSQISLGAIHKKDVENSVDAGKEIWICECGYEKNEGDFCVNCGKPRDLMGEGEIKKKWDCSCGHINNTGKFCSFCGNPCPKVGEMNDVSQVTMQQPKVTLPPQPPKAAQAAPQPAYTASQPENKAKPILIALVVVLAAAVLFFVVRGFMEPATSVNKTNGSAAKQTTEKQAPAVDSDLSLGGVSLGYSVDKLHEILGREKEQKKGDYGTTVYLYDGLKVGIKDGIVVGLTSDAVR